LIPCSSIPTLLSSERLESDALEARDLGLEEAKVYERRAAVILSLGVVDAVDLEDRDTAAVGASDHDLAQLAATQKPKGPKKKIIGLKHTRLPFTGRAGLG
jgi:hypothetical protein